MLSQRGKPLLVHDGHTFGIQYVRKDKKYWQCNLSRKFNCKARVTTTDTGEIIVTNNEHCHTEIRQHLRKDYQRHKVMMNALINLSTNRLAVENFRRHNSIANNLSNLQQNMVAATSTSPLALQSHIEGTADPNAAGILLDLGKRSALSMENEDQLKHHHPHHQLHHQHLQQPQSANNVEDDVENDEPLDCGLKSSLSRDHSERDERNIKNENNDAQQSSNNINNDRNDEWQCKNEAIQ